jgi:hypothetical protein
MERRISKKVNDFVHNFKTEVVDKMKQHENNIDSEILLDVMNFIYKYQNFELSKEDFMKRKRVKNMVPNYERCCAKRANGQQCTRRKKDESQYCGTHSKGTPHGIMSDTDVTSTITKVEVSAIDIKGIIYYLDDKGNVYDTEDIISNKKNPRVIANYVKNGDEYNIPSLFP